MKQGAWILASALLSALACTPAQAGPDAPTARYLGAGSCAAAACHNAPPEYGPVHGEYGTWMSRDAHARAYEVLHNAVSARIQKNLGHTTPAHEDSRCLRCHVALDYDVKAPPAAAPYFRTDGVSCESCHGGARDWLTQHHLDAWRFQSPAAKKKLGMNDTRSLSGRAQLCASCHVGAAGRDVDHDLIAAGHPRLNFEFAAFHAHMPRHWPDAKDGARRDFDVRAWLAGQLVTAHASLELLAERSGNPAHVWPEFAEFDCAACHHNLRAESPRQKLGFGVRRPGAYPWGHQTALAPVAFEHLQRSDSLRQPLAALQKLMDAGNPKRGDVAVQARAAAAQLKLALARLDQVSLNEKDAEAIHAFLVERGKKLPAPSDEWTHLQLALSALRPGAARLKGLPAPGAPPFDPEAIRARLSILTNPRPLKGP